MRYVDRSAVPAPLSLSQADGKGQNELVEARVYYGPAAKPEKAFPFEAYRSDDVKQALRNLFHGKCAYCESLFAGTQPPDIEHYRPKGGIEESKPHPGYWWLAMAWTNLLPSCIDCNRRRGQVVATADMSLADLQAALSALGAAEPMGKQNAFPTLDNAWAQAEGDPESCEQPALIDPTRTDPAEHLSWPEAELPVVVPQQNPAGQQCPRAVASIDIYALNRLGLVQARAEVLRTLHVQLEAVRHFMEAAEEAAPANKTKAYDRLDQAVAGLRTFREAQRPYSAMAQAVIERFEEELASWQAAYIEAAA